MLIKIENIPKTVTKPDLRKLFNKFGAVTAILKRENSAFIHMPSNRRARIAATTLNGTRWEGNAISVKISERNINSTVCNTSLGIMRMF